MSLHRLESSAPSLCLPVRLLLAFILLLPASSQAHPVIGDLPITFASGLSALLPSLPTSASGLSSRGHSPPASTPWPHPLAWTGSHASAVWYDSGADECFVALLDQNIAYLPVQRIRLLGSQPDVLQNYSITVPYDEVFNVQATAQSVLVLSGVQIDQHHFNFTLTIKKRDTGDDAGVLQLDDTVMADVAVWNATVPTQILLVTPGADSALSVDPLSGAVLAEWTGNVPRLDLQGAAFVHANASFGTAAAPHTSACVVLMHYSRRVDQPHWQLLVVGCNNQLLANISLDSGTDQLGSVRASADGTSVFALTHVTVDEGTLDGNWYQFAQYDLRSGKLLSLQRMWQYGVIPQAYFSLGRTCSPFS